MSPTSSSAPPPLTGLSETGRFPREARVRKSWEFRRIHRDGVRVQTRCFTVIACRTLKGQQARLGCAISRKVGSAVVRNRLRRLLRETFRRTRHRLPAFDFVIIVHPSAAARHVRAGLASVSRELMPAWNEAAQKAAHRAGARRRRRPRRKPRAGSSRPEKIR